MTPNPHSTPNNTTAQTNIHGDVSTAGGLVNTGVIDTQGGAVIGRDLKIESLSVTIHEALALEEQSPTPGAPPYKGLTFYDEQDENVYFGRRTLAADLVEQITTQPLLTIVGASGSGKSSLVRAGLLPQLRRAGWHCMIMRPSAHPLHELALALWPTDATARQTFIATAYHDDQALLNTIAPFAAQSPAPRALLIIDQLEELFTLAKVPVANAAFVANLLTLRPDAPLTVILVLRADFYHRCADFANLPAAVAAHQRYLAPMTRHQLAEVILQPLHQGGWRLQEGLVDLLLADTLDEPGSLPFLSHALHESWSRRRANVLTLSAYLATGGVKGAIAATAEDVWRNFTPSEQATARAILIELTELGEQDRDQPYTPDTRRRRTYADLTTLGLSQSDLDTTLEALVRRRLLTRDHDQIEVAHEALIRAWDRLQAWLAADRETLRLTRQLQTDAATWVQHYRDPSFLYTGARLAQAIEWSQVQSTPPIGPIAEFLQCSQTTVEHAQRKELEHTQALAAAQTKRAEAETNRARTFRWAAIIAITLLLIAVAAAGWATKREGDARTSARLSQAESTRALNAESTAQAQTTVANFARATADVNAANAQSRALTAASQVVRNSDPMRAWLLAIESGRTADTDQAFVAINEQDHMMGKQLRVLTHNEPIWGVQWDRDETRVLSWSEDLQSAVGEVRIWDVTSGVPLLVLAHNSAAQWNRNKTRVLSWNDHKVVSIWDAVTGNQLHTFSHDSAIRGTEWNRNESRLLTWSEDKILRVWNATTDKLLYALPHEENVMGARWNQNETRILSWSSDLGASIGKIYTWDATTGNPLLTLSHDDPVGGAEWNRNETRILSWSGDIKVGTGDARVWDAVTGDLIHTFTHDGDVGGAQWNHDETRILSWSWNFLEDTGDVRVWDAATGDLLHTLAHDDGVQGARWNHDETLILSWDGNVLDETGNVRIWDAITGNRLLTLVHHGYVNGAKWNRDESRILSSSFDNTIRVWDAHGTLLLTLTHDGVRNAQWNHDETHILSWGQDKTIRLWNATTGDLLPTLTHNDIVRNAQWNHDETRILSWSEDKTVHLWDAATGTLLHSFIHDDAVRGAQWNHNETQILSWSEDKTARLWDAVTGDLLLTLAQDGWVDAQWNNDETRILSWSDNKVAQIWNAFTGDLIFTLAHNDWVYGAQWNHNGTRILSWSGDNMIRLWDAISGNLLRSFTVDGGVGNARWNGDETRILSWGFGSNIHVWDAVGGELLLTLTQSMSAHGVRWNRDETLILSSHDDLTTRVWDAVTGELLRTLTHDNNVLGSQWNSDETRILTWSGDAFNAVGDVRVWDAITGAPLFVLVHDGAVHGAQWNHDETYILSWCGDGTARLWNAQTGLLIHTFTGDGSPVIRAYWNQAETQIMLTTRNGHIYRYYTHMPALLTAACTRATRNLTWAEWQQFLPGEPYRTTCPNLPIHHSVPPEMIATPPPS